MEVMEAIETTAPAPVKSRGARRIPVPRWLADRRVLIALAAALLLGSLTLGWRWLAAIGVAPLILSLGPCLAMCAVGACMGARGCARSARQEGDAANRAAGTGGDAPIEPQSTQ
jgi:hypothetical protein